MSDYDQFGDVMYSQAGIFGDDQSGLDKALHHHDKVTMHVKRDGAIAEMHCDGCGRGVRIVIEWPELVALKYGVPPALAFQGTGLINSPTPWEYLPSENAWRINGLHCSHCGFHFPLRIEPHEPEKFLKHGRQAGYINKQREAQVSQLAAQAAQRLGR